MKQFLLCISILCSALTVFSQSYHSWEIFENRKKVAGFNNKKQTDAENKILLLRRALDEPGFFIITFNATKTEEDWNRSFAICDSADRELKKFSNMSELRMLNSDIYGLIGIRQGVKIYTWAIPRDPDLAASIRVRRILLCTIYTR